jgi:hypothetical protein
LNAKTLQLRTHERRRRAMKENKKIDNVCKSQSIGDVDEMIQP